ncbi:MAG: carboxylesterase family protein [Oscillospiraceae bacterium]|nr:carboxylesterase family protein [Oscillospiraceae bacterium]
MAVGKGVSAMFNKEILGSVTLQTDCGALRGNERENCLEFLGVPYAHAGRFEYAVPVEKWDGVLDATRPGPACPQNRAWHEHLENPTRRFYKREFREGSVFVYDEDCLNLNIFTPKKAEGCPVILFFHGGGFDSGINSEDPFDGAAFAARGIVTVFANYRLGPLGWLTHEEIRAKTGRDGNFGLDDQLAAIRWVKQNIAAFGGDGGNITLLGQSAGAISIQYHCLNHANAGLFRRAAMMSGGGMFPRFALPRRAEDTHAYWRDYMDAAGCATLDELRSASLDTLFDAVEEIKKRRKDSIYNTMPVIDGVLLPAPVDELIKTPLPLDYLLGFTNTDMYAPLMAYIALRFARANGGYVYFFDLDAPGDGNGGFHSSDLRYMFGTLASSWRPYGARDEGASGQLLGYLSNFARTGEPNGPGLPPWERTGKGRARVLRIASESTKMSYVNYWRLSSNFLKRGDPKA